MTLRQSTRLDRRKLLADPVMVITILLLFIFLTLFILYPLVMLLADSVFSSDAYTAYTIA